MKLRGKYIPDVAVTTIGNVILLTFKDPTRNKNINSVYQFIPATNELIFIGNQSGAIKEGSAGTSILSDGTVLLFSASSPTTSGNDCELVVSVIGKVKLETAAPVSTPVPVPVLAADTVNKIQTDIHTLQAAIKNILAANTTDKKAIEGIAYEQAGKRFNAEIDGKNQKLLDLIWSKVVDGVYGRLKELGLLK